MRAGPGQVELVRSRSGETEGEVFVETGRDGETVAGDGCPRIQCGEKYVRGRGAGAVGIVESKLATGGERPSRECDRDISIPIVGIQFLGCKAQIGLNPDRTGDKNGCSRGDPEIVCRATGGICRRGDARHHITWVIFMSVPSIVGKRVAVNDGTVTQMPMGCEFPSFIDDS